jgi:hypothetical protein
VSTIDDPGPAAGPLPPHAPPRLPGERLLRRRAPMPDVVATSPHPGGLLVRRGAWTAVVLRGNAPAGALWLDPAGHWRAAPGARAALAVSGDPDEEALWAMEGRAPSFRRFAEARDWLLGELGEGGGAPAAPPSGGTDPEGGNTARDGRSRGQVVQLATRRAPPRRR